MRLKIGYKGLRKGKMRSAHLRFLSVCVLILSMISLNSSFTEAVSSGYKGVYGKVIDSVHPQGHSVQILVNIGWLNWTCLSDKYQTAADGTYSIDLFTLKDINGADCRYLWREGDSMFALVDNSPGNVEEIDCYGDPNCGGSQMLPNFVFDTPISGGDDSGTSDPVKISAADRQKAKSILAKLYSAADDSLKIKNVIYIQYGNELEFKVTIVNDGGAIYHDLSLQLSIKGDGGNVLLKSEYPSLDMNPYQVTEVKMVQDARGIEPGYYYASLILINDGSAADVFGDWSILIEAVPIVEEPSPIADTIDGDAESEDTGSGDLFKLVIAVVLFLIIFYSATHSITYILRVKNK